jgi:hypothetical protein
MLDPITTGILNSEREAMVYPVPVYLACECSRQLKVADVLL